ncbi:MAG: hypothetical protein ACLTBV_14415 [Enterocloster bolteae]
MRLPRCAGDMYMVTGDEEIILPIWTKNWEIPSAAPRKSHGWMTV